MTMGDSRPRTIMDFVQRYRDYEAQRDATHEFIKDLMVYADNVESTMRNENTRLIQQLSTLTMDLDDATNSRRQLQLRIQDMEEKLGSSVLQNDQAKNQNPYALVLIDGDGLIFHQSFIKQGTEGGRKAAVELHKAVVSDLALQPGTRVLVTILANFDTLNKALDRDGAVDSEKDLYDFAKGFNQATFFEFVDVGAVPEGVMLKVKETALFHLQNPSCKRIVMGASHNHAYGSILDDIIKGDAERLERIKILEGSPAVRAVASIGTEILKFDHIFRSDKLSDKRTVSSHSVQSVKSASSRSTSTSGLPSVSYATVTQKASPPPQITLPIPLAPKTNSAASRIVKQPPKPVWNPGPRGLDAPIPLNQTALETIKKRKDSNKLCNNHFLRGPCTKGDECGFVHDYNPNKDEKNAIAFLARLNPCTNGQDCDVDNCIYGHHCPSVVNGICTHPFCKFRPEEHPPGTKLRSAKV